MNELTHFLAAAVVGRAIKGPDRKFYMYYTGLAGLIPDFDFLFAHFVPGFEHGVATHTLIWGSLIAVCLALVAWLACRFLAPMFYRENGISLKSLLCLGLLGMLIHLLLDSFTYYTSFEVDGTHHLYLWPFWNFSFHINTIFPGTSYETRVWVEVLFTAAVAGYLLFYLWPVKGENPFVMFSPWHWNGDVSRIGGGKKAATWKKVLVTIVAIVPGAACVFLLDFVSGLLVLTGILLFFHVMDHRARNGAVQRNVEIPSDG